MYVTESELWAEHSESDWIVTSTWKPGLRCRLEDGDVHGSAVHDGADDDGGGNGDDEGGDGDDGGGDCNYLNFLGSAGVHSEFLQASVKEIDDMYNYT